jgi:hypothetical protein
LTLRGAIVKDARATGDFPTIGAST